MVVVDPVVVVLLVVVVVGSGGGDVVVEVDICVVFCSANVAFSSAGFTELSCAGGVSVPRVAGG